MTSTGWVRQSWQRTFAGNAGRWHWIQQRRSPGVVCPRTFYTDLNKLRLLAIFGEMESTGTSTTEMERLPLSNSAVFLTLSWTGKRCKTSKQPRFTKYGQEPKLICKI
jgi:hypothetical protein